MISSSNDIERYAEITNTKSTPVKRVDRERKKWMEKMARQIVIDNGTIWIKKKKKKQTLVGKWNGYIVDYKRKL